MNTWLKVNLGDAMLATGMLADLESRLARVYEEEGRPSTMLAVYRHESSELHCSVMVYLTADFQRASLLENAIHCAMPAMSDAGFLAGNKASMKQ